MKKNDRLYLKLLRPAPGVVIGSNELPNLPPSVVATLNSERTSGGYTALALSQVYERELAPAEFVWISLRVVIFQSYHSQEFVHSVLPLVAWNVFVYF